MRLRVLAGALALVFVASPPLARANDVDGGPDCSRIPPSVDFGDAPEDVLAYPGVIGHFPTCIASGSPGNQTTVCPPLGTAPIVTLGTGYVKHTLPAVDRIWLGCHQGQNGPQGIDTDADGKVNDTGGAVSSCNPNNPVDCTETAFGITWGQDECYGDDDAALTVAPTFKACQPGNVGWSIPAWSCSNVQHAAYLNILIDWNQDGDWNDNVSCASGCVQEWAVKNFITTLNPGCNNIPVPTFRVGPNPGPSWMRITLSDDPGPDDFPWNGSASTATLTLHNGETEDYPVRILPSVDPCSSYEDWGDAPEEAMAYPGVIGHFPTCAAPGAPGTPDWACAPLGTLPGPTGYVRHIASATDQAHFWLGCGNAVSPGVDSEIDGKMNDTGGPFSSCNPTVAVDGVDFFGMSWGQDESYGDGVDSGLLSPTTVFFKTCQPATLDYQTFSCGTIGVDAFLNVLVDMNEDGDWNDNFLCDQPTGPTCVHEWAIHNLGIVLAPGCQTHTTPQFLIGPNSGKGWMRITLTRTPVGADFPWNGSASQPNGYFQGGETEDYPVMIRPANVGVNDETEGQSLMLAPISPNPAGNRVAIRFVLPRAANVSLAAYDVAGRKLADLATGHMEAGAHSVDWNFRDQRGREFAAGYYLIRLRVGDKVLSQGGIRVR